MDPGRTTSATHYELLSAGPEVKASSDRVLGLVLAAFFELVALAPVLHGRPVRGWSFVVGLICLTISVAIPRALHPLNVVWVRFAIVLHRIVSPIAMALLFFLAFALTGILLRALGKDLLRLKKSPGKDSYWIVRDAQGPARESMLHQF